MRMTSGRYDAGARRLTAVVLIGLVVGGCTNASGGDSGAGEDEGPPPVAEFCELSADAGTHDSWEPFREWFEEYRAGVPEEMPASARACWEWEIDVYEEVDEEFFDEAQWDELYDSVGSWSAADRAAQSALDSWEKHVC